MTRSLVLDASVVVALLLDAGPDGAWVAEQVQAPGAHLLAPSLCRFEVADIIRRRVAAGALGPDHAAQAHGDLLDLALEEWPYALLAARTWELRANLTMYDASYVALADLTSATLLTFDHRLARSPGVRCTVLTGPEGPGG